MTLTDSGVPDAVGRSAVRRRRGILLAAVIGAALAGSIYALGCTRLSGETLEFSRLRVYSILTRDSAATFQVGSRLWEGDGVRRSRKDAVDWIRKAANAGSLEAMEFLSLSSRSGSVQEAEQWYERLIAVYRARAYGGDRVAMHRLSELLSDTAGPFPTLPGCVRVASTRELEEADYWRERAHQPSTATCR